MHLGVAGLHGSQGYWILEDMLHLRSHQACGPHTTPIRIQHIIALPPHSRTHLRLRTLPRFTPALRIQLLLLLGILLKHGLGPRNGLLLLDFLWQALVLLEQAALVELAEVEVDLHEQLLDLVAGVVVLLVVFGADAQI